MPHLLRVMAYCLVLCVHSACVVRRPQIIPLLFRRPNSRNLPPVLNLRRSRPIATLDSRKPRQVLPRDSCGGGVVWVAYGCKSCLTPRICTVRHSALGATGLIIAVELRYCSKFTIPCQRLQPNLASVGIVLLYEFFWRNHICRCNFCSAA